MLLVKARNLEPGAQAGAVFTPPVTILEAELFSKE
jgi:hypothetical protein